MCLGAERDWRIAPPDGGGQFTQLFDGAGDDRTGLGHERGVSAFGYDSSPLVNRYWGVSER